MTALHPVLLFFAPGVPAPQGSKNAYQRGNRVVQVEASKGLPAWRAAVMAAAMMLWRTEPPIVSAVTVEVEFVRPRPKKFGITAVVPRLTATPDLDKMCRSVGDALVDAGALKDDALIDRWVASKRYARWGEQSGAWVSVHTRPVSVRLESA